MKRKSPRGDYVSDVGLARSVSAMKLAIDPKVGIIRTVTYVKTLGHESNLFLCYAQPASVLALAGIEGANQGGACAVTAERAFLRACGEAIERYCSCFPATEKFILRSEQELSSLAVSYFPTDSFYPFSSSQYTDDFPFDSRDQTRAVQWVEARTHGSDSAVLVPASCIYVPYRFDRRIEPFSHMPISTGLACGPTREFAIEKGILEILERDALMIVWHRGLRTSRVDVSSCFGKSSELDTLLHAAESEGSTWHLNVLTLDVDVPIVSAALINPEGLPMTSFGIAADFDVARAIARAMEEALLSRFLLNRSDLSAAAEVVLPNPRTLRHHLIAHAISPELRNSLRFLTEAERVVKYDELVESGLKKNEKRDTVELLERSGLKAIYLDITTPDVKEIGFSVVRVLIPGTQPLDNDHLYPFLGGERLMSVPRALGYDLKNSVPNSAPHPFP